MLDSFPQDAEAPATRYLLGEVLFESGRFADAAREYERTAYDYPLHAKSSDAGYAALIAYQKHEPSLSGESKALWHRQAIESSLMFATSFPEHAESARVLTKSDEELFALNEFDRVIEVSKQILERKPAGRARLSAHRGHAAGALVVRSSALRRSRSGLRARERPTSPRTIPTGRRSRSASRPRSTSRPKRSSRRATQSAPSTTSCASVRWRRTRRCAPTRSSMPRRILIDRQAVGSRAQVLESFRRNYPNHELMPQVDAQPRRRVSRNRQFDAGGRRVRAHRGAAEETADVRRAALWQAAELYEKSASPTNAARLYASYVQQYPLPLDPAMEARQKLADMAKAQNDYKARAQWNDDIIRADAMRRCRAHGSQQVPRGEGDARRRRAAGRDVQCDQAGRAARQVAQVEAHADGEGPDCVRQGAGLSVSPR